MVRRQPEIERQASFLDEQDLEDRRFIPSQLLRWTLAFCGLFAAVFVCFWWSGSAIKFGALRVAENPEPTWRVFGTVRNALTHEPVPWALVRDDPGGRPPFYRTDADQGGAFALLTLAEPHQLRIDANGFRTTTVSIGRQWFIWWPKGTEHKDIELTPN